MQTLMIELAVEFTRSFGAPEMAQMTFGMIASVLIGAALGLISALFEKHQAQVLPARIAIADHRHGDMWAKIPATSPRA